MRIAAGEVFALLSCFARAELEYLLSLAGIAVDRNPLQPQLPSAAVDGCDLLDGCRLRHVDRLGDGVIGVLLEGRLDAQVVLRRDVQGCPEKIDSSRWTRPGLSL